MKHISLILIFLSFSAFSKTTTKAKKLPVVVPVPAVVMELNQALSSLNIYGDSNIKKWDTKAVKFSGTGSFEMEGEKIKKINSFIFSLDSADIKSGSDTMDEHTANALEVAKFPKITGTIKESTVAENKVTGTMEFDLHGVKKSLPFTSTISLSGSKLTVEGEQPLNITDFGIIPPATKIIFVTATAKPEINIKYKLELETK